MAMGSCKVATEAHHAFAAEPGVCPTARAGIANLDLRRRCSCVHRRDSRGLIEAPINCFERPNDPNARTPERSERPNDPNDPNDL
jgi:hypothetical protein